MRCTDHQARKNTSNVRRGSDSSTSSSNRSKESWIHQYISQSQRRRSRVLIDGEVTEIRAARRESENLDTEEKGRRKRPEERHVVRKQEERKRLSKENAATKKSRLDEEPKRIGFFGYLAASQLELNRRTAEEKAQKLAMEEAAAEKKRVEEEARKKRLEEQRISRQREEKQRLAEEEELLRLEEEAWKKRHEERRAVRRVDEKQRLAEERARALAAEVAEVEDRPREPCQEEKEQSEAMPILEEKRVDNDGMIMCTKASKRQSRAIPATVLWMAGSKPFRPKKSKEV